MRTVVITGGTKGLGRALAEAFGCAGFHVVALYHLDDAAADRLRDDLAAIDCRAIVVKQDVAELSSPESLANLPHVAGAEELVLLNNACAAFSPQAFHLTAWEGVKRGIATAVGGAYLCTQALVHPLVKTRGTIVNVLSDVVHGTPPKGFSGYIAAKYGLLGLTRALATELGPLGVRVFSVSPGFMETGLTASWDARLRSPIAAAATPVARVANEILELVTNREQVAGQGEDYRLPK